ncbi:MAG TPA: hypothetical protein VF032_01605 [Thermoleophilaceae bacterium]
MDAEPTEPAPRRSTAKDSTGLMVKATRRGSLVLETENARRMMRRFRKLRPEREQGGDPRAAGATP